MNCNDSDFVNLLKPSTLYTSNTFDSVNSETNPPLNPLTDYSPFLGIFIFGKSAALVLFAIATIFNRAPVSLHKTTFLFMFVCDVG